MPPPGLTGGSALGAGQSRHAQALLGHLCPHLQGPLCRHLLAWWPHSEASPPHLRPRCVGNREWNTSQTHLSGTPHAAEPVSPGSTSGSACGRWRAAWARPKGPALPGHSPSVTPGAVAGSALPSLALFSASSGNPDHTHERERPGPLSTVPFVLEMSLVGESPPRHPNRDTLRCAVNHVIGVPCDGGSCV